LFPLATNTGTEEKTILAIELCAFLRRSRALLPLRSAIQLGADIVMESITLIVLECCDFTPSFGQHPQGREHIFVNGFHLLPTFRKVI
jgi:hypothetical protein